MNGYLVAWIRVHDPARYELSRGEALDVLDRLGADLLAAAEVGRGEGDTSARVLICAFPSYIEAQRAVRSRQFATARRLMRAAAEFDYVVLPGVAPDEEGLGEVFPFDRAG